MSQDVNLALKLHFKMLVVFSNIFVADTKIIFRYDFVAPLKFDIADNYHYHCLDQFPLRQKRNVRCAQTKIKSFIF